MKSKWLSLLICLAPCLSHALDGKVAFSYGAFSIDATSGKNSSSISQPLLFAFSYQKSLINRLAFNVGYSILLGDSSASDMGYGLNIGADYYWLNSMETENLTQNEISVKRNSLWKPYAGLGFYQRNFQSIRNSYAGLGMDAGIERSYNDKLSFKAELRYIKLAGSGDSEATEKNALLGLVYEL